MPSRGFTAGPAESGAGGGWPMSRTLLSRFPTYRLLVVFLAVVSALGGTGCATLKPGPAACNDPRVTCSEIERQWGAAIEEIGRAVGAARFGR